MNITVTGTNEHFSKLLIEAANFFANILMDPRMVRNLNIEVEVDKNSDYEGECIDEEGTKNPRWFTISLKQQELEDMIRVLAHEMVHVKQHAKNELQSGYVVPARGGLKITSKWKGTLWKPKRQEDPYFDSPWELEAYGKEVGLFQRYITFRDKLIK